MKNSQPAEHSPGITLGDIYFVLFRHKWKIIFCALIGISAAVVFYLVKLPPFQSEAELLIRYVLDSRSPNPTANNTRETLPTDLGDSIINDEIKILTSLDLTKEVAANIGPEKILAKLGGGNDLMTAAGVVSGGLKVEATSRSSVIN